MNNFSLSVFIDGALSAALSFFIFKALSSLFISNNAASLIISAAAGIAVCFLVCAFKIKKNKRLLIKKAERRLMESTLAEFEIMPASELNGWFLNLLSRLNAPAKSCKGYLLTQSGCKCFIDYGKTFTRAKAAEILKKVKKTDEIILFCNRAEEDARSLFKTFSCSVYIAEPAELFALMKKANYFYEPKILPFRGGANAKNKLKTFFKNAFTKKRAAAFTLTGLAALALAPLTFFKKYYVIYALISFLIAAFCLFFGKNKTEKNKTPPIFSD